MTRTTLPRKGLVVITRRRFLSTSLFAAMAGSSPARLTAAVPNRRPRILLRSSWQIVNIGDIAHTPGLLALLERHLPDADVRLWASADLSPEVIAMEHRRFPGLRIVKGRLGADGRATNADLEEAVEWSDFLLHGSGPSMVAHRDVAAYVGRTGKPFGVYGITYGGFGTAERDLLGQARFVFFRDSVSLARAKADGIACPIMEFGPDAAFAADVRDDARATVFLKENGLEDGRFVCCIPRLRYTPYWKIRGQPMNDESRRRDARNEAMKEHDHVPLREAIAVIARETDLKVLVCPEDMSQMEVGREMLVDRLPSEVQRRVVWRREFWLTDEALSTYVRSAGLFGLEMHSPIMAVGNGIPAIVGRFEEQTSKGVMWRDIGLGDWLFDLDEDGVGPRYVAAVRSMILDRTAALERVRRAAAFVERRQRETMAVVKTAVRG